jgi:hypothetical protein
MIEDRLDQPLPEPGVALFRDDKDVGKIRKGRLIGDNPREADLDVFAVKAESHRMGNRAT